MRTWKKFLKSLTREPAGFRAADGRVLGLGLATAQKNAREQATREVEDFLRKEATEQPQSTTRA